MEARILAGLPATGPLPVQFSESGLGTHHEGTVVEFVDDSGASWIGNFQGGFTSFEGVFKMGSSIFIIACGKGYLIDPQSRQTLRYVSDSITNAIAIAGTTDLLLCDGTSVERVGTLQWKSKRISWDGFKNVRVVDKELHGDSWSPIGDNWISFRVNLDTGEHTGGSYDEDRLRRRT